MSDHRSQRSKILDYMRKHGSITTLEAMQELIILDPRKRISELRDEGYDIPDEWEKSASGKRYKRYYGRNLPLMQMSLYS